MMEIRRPGRPSKHTPQKIVLPPKKSETVMPEETPAPEPAPSDPPLEGWQHIGPLLQNLIGRLDAQDKKLAEMAKKPVGRRGRPPARGPAAEDRDEVILDRSGNVVTRRAVRSIDPFELPEEFTLAQQQDDYTSEWKSFRVLNEDMDAYINDLYNDGWVPVKNERIPGRYGGEPEEAIIHQGMMLMERPAGLSRMAHREQHIASREQVNSRKRDWGVDESRKRVFDPEGRFGENLNRIRSNIEQVPSASYPQHDIASADEL